jgi:hypothetical protein
LSVSSFEADQARASESAKRRERSLENKNSTPGALDKRSRNG